MNPTLRQLQAFVLAYRSGSLTRAADQMFITQSAVSVLIRQLEDSLGLRLFDRTSRSLHPTAAARETLPTAERMLRDLDTLKAGARGLAARERGILSFAASPALAASLLPELIAEYQRRFPDIAVRMLDVDPGALVAPVIADEVEFSIGTVAGRPDGVDLSCLLRDHVSVICGKDSPLAAQRSVQWKQLAGQRCITVKQGAGIRNLIDDTLRGLGMRLEPAFEVSYLTTALAMAAAGLGVAVLPGFLLASFPHHGLVARRLERPGVTRDIHLITRAGHSLSPAAAGFVELWKQRVAATGLRPGSTAAPVLPGSAPARASSRPPAPRGSAPRQ